VKSCESKESSNSWL